jgi:hypothetical protein
MQKYALSVISTVLIGTVLTDLLPSGTAKGIFKTIFGLLLTLVVISPFRDLTFSFPETFSDLFQNAAEAAASEGELASQIVLEEIIKEEVQTYIQDKAAALQLEITAEVTLRAGDPPVPDSVVIHGAVSPYFRIQLEKILEEQLGIPKEKMEWTG